jgi:fructokinase
MGECLIDFLPMNTHEQDTSTDFRMYAAGSLFNVAMGLARLGQTTAFASKVADDYFGRFLRKHIEAEQIDTRFLALAAGKQSTLAFVAMENGSPVFNFYGEEAADTLLTLEDLPEALFAETRILHFGSISLLRGTTPKAVLQTVERLHGKALLSLDLNIRPALVQDEPQYRTLLQRLIALADVVKLSDADLAWFRPHLSVEQALSELLTQGPALAVITRGAQGVIAARMSGAMVQVPNFAVQVVDTVGAGDSFCAGLLAQLAERGMITKEAVLEISEATLSEILRFAAAVAALNCMQAGANPPSRAEVERFLRLQKA